MGITSELITVKITNLNKKKYEKLGYKIEKDTKYIKINYKDAINKTKSLIDVECDLCGKVRKNLKLYDFERSGTYENFGYDKYFCSQCSIKIISRKNNKSKINEYLGEEYEAITLEPGKKNKKIKIRHKKCNTVYEDSLFTLKRGRKCPTCTTDGWLSVKKDTVWFKKQVYSKVENEYTVLGEYVTSNDKIEMRHSLCGHIYHVTPCKFLQGRRCPNCFICRAKTTKDFKMEIEDLDKNYAFVGQYESNKHKTDFLHKKCNKIFSMRPSDFLKGQRCPYCSDTRNSKGVKKIEEYLSKHTSIRKECTYDECVYKRKLPFDFCVNNKFLIEYDGEQHFRAAENWGGKSTLLECQKRDRKKNEFCISNDIPLFRIPYWEINNIENILSNILQYFSLEDKKNSYDENLVLKYMVTRSWDHKKYIKRRL